MLTLISKQDWSLIHDYMEPHIDKISLQFNEAQMVGEVEFSSKENRVIARSALYIEARYSEVSLFVDIKKRNNENIFVETKRLWNVFEYDDDPLCTHVMAQLSQGRTYNLTRL